MRRATAGPQSRQAIAVRRQDGLRTIGGWAVKKTARERRKVLLLNRKEHMDHHLEKHKDCTPEQALGTWKMTLEKAISRTNSLKIEAEENKEHEKLEIINSLLNHYQEKKSFSEL